MIPVKNLIYNHMEFVYNVLAVYGLPFNIKE